MNAGVTYQRLARVAAAPPITARTIGAYHAVAGSARRRAIATRAPAATATSRPTLRSRCMSWAGASPAARPRTPSRRARSRAGSRWPRRTRRRRRAGRRNRASRRRRRPGRPRWRRRALGPEQRDGVGVERARHHQARQGGGLRRVGRANRIPPPSAAPAATWRSGRRGPASRATPRRPRGRRRRPRRQPGRPPAGRRRTSARPVRTPSTTSRRRPLRRGGSPTIAAGRTPTARAMPRRASSMATSPAGRA